jgi:hypothetical protein
MEHTQAYESPKSFWKWAAYAAIASVLRDSCFRKQGDVVTYPNIYVLLLADSAVHRKGNPVKLCEKLVAAVHNTKVISGRASIQAILDELARGETNPKTGKVLAGGSALFSASELSAGIVNDPEAIKILTDIYDYKDEYTSRLRGTGTFRIKNICFSMLAASNEDLLVDIYDTKAIFGGLLGRTFLVKPNEFRGANSLFDFPDTTESFNRLLEMLQKIGTLQGEFEFTPAARAEYETWYIPFRESYKDKADKSGVAGRLHIGVLKLAMIFAVNYNLNLQIDRHHIEEAILECMGLIPNYSSFIMSSGKSPDSACGSIVLQMIYAAPNHRAARKEILFKHLNQFTLEQFDQVIEKLRQAGMITEDMVGEGIAYRLTQKCIDTLFSTEIAKGSGAK